MRFRMTARYIYRNIKVKRVKYSMPSHISIIEIEDIQLSTVVEYHQLLKCPHAIIHR